MLMMQVNGFQLGVILLPRGQVMISGHTVGCTVAVELWATDG